MGKPIVGSMSEWSGLLKDFFRQIEDGSFTLEQMIELDAHCNPFAAVKIADTGVKRKFVKDQIKKWEKFYKNHFNLDCDFSNVMIPACPGEGWRLLIIANVSLEKIYARCGELFGVWRWTNNNLDEIVTWNERDAKNGAYAIWVKDVQEADENLKNLSANDIKSKDITTETLAERMFHELIYFTETGKHLDITNWTLCTGSRYRDGRVPNVNWNPDDRRADVYRYDPDDALGRLRARQIVSNLPKAD